MCGSTVGKAAALRHVSFVVELVCEEGGLGHREMVSAHCLLLSCPQLVCYYFPFTAVVRAAARGLTLNGWAVGAVAVPLLQCDLVLSVG